MQQQLSLHGNQDHLILELLWILDSYPEFVANTERQVDTISVLLKASGHGIST
jgi:hypothetical protein